MRIDVAQAARHEDMQRKSWRGAMATAIRQASSSDVGFISRLMMDGARDRHFHPQPIHIVQAMSKSIIAQGRFMRIAENRGIEWVDAALWVAEENNHFAGFMLCAKEKPGSEKVEVYFLSTNRRFRRHGIAKKLVEFAMHTYSAPILARVLKKSTYAAAIFENHGFKLTESNSRGRAYEWIAVEPNTDGQASNSRTPVAGGSFATR